MPLLSQFPRVQRAVLGPWGRITSPHSSSYKRVSMGLTVRRKTAKNLAVRRKNERILAVSRKKN